MLMLSNATGSGHVRIGAMAMMDFCDLQDCRLESLVWQRYYEIDASIIGLNSETISMAVIEYSGSAINGVHWGRPVRHCRMADYN